MQRFRTSHHRRKPGVIVVHTNNPTGHFTGRKKPHSSTRYVPPARWAIIADEVFLDFSLGASKKVLSRTPAP